MTPRSYSSLILIAFAVLGQAQTILYQADFEDPNAFVLNTTDVGSQTMGANTWLINNVYAGGTGDILCFGIPFDYTIPSTPAQPAGISNANGNYLHIASTEAINDGILCCSFAAADGFCIDPGNNFARMAADITTTGNSSVELSFWWVCNGGIQSYGEVYYSTNSGTTWSLITTPIAQYSGQSTWTQQSISLPAFADQNTLRFGFRFVNNTSFQGGEDPGFAIDDIRISGTTSAASVATGAVPTSLCASGSPFMVPYTVTGTFTAGNVFTAELSDAAGSFSSPTVIGSVQSTTSGSIDATIPVGTPAGSSYRIRVNASAPLTMGMDNGSDITIEAIPNAGTNTTLIVCSDNEPFDLLSALNGTPDPGGTWTGPAGDVPDGQFDPATSPVGLYVYTVGGPACPLATGMINISVSQAPYAGMDHTGELCSSDGPILLFPYLGEGAMTGGMWTGPGGAAFNGIFIPGTGVPGCFTYTVPGFPPCASDAAVVCVTGLVDAPDAGMDNSVVVCMNTGSYDLFDALEGTPETGGTWTDQNNAPVPDGIIDLNTHPVGSYPFTYTVEAPPCEPATATVTLLVDPCAGIGNERNIGTPFVAMDGMGRYILRTEERAIGLDIFNAAGMSIRPARISFDHNVTTVDLTGLSAGVYLITVRTDAGIATVRVPHE